MNILDRVLFVSLQDKDIKFNYRVETIDFRTREIGILDLEGNLEYYSFDNIIQVFDGGVLNVKPKINIIDGTKKSTNGNN